MSICRCCGQIIASDTASTARMPWVADSAIRVDETVLALCNDAHEDARARHDDQVEILHLSWALVRTRSAHSNLQAHQCEVWALSEALENDGIHPGAATTANVGSLRTCHELKTLLRRAEARAALNGQAYASLDDVVGALVFESDDLRSAHFMRQARALSARYGDDAEHASPEQHGSFQQPLRNPEGSDGDWRVGHRADLDSMTAQATYAWQTTQQEQQAHHRSDDGFREAPRLLEERLERQGRLLEHLVETFEAFARRSEEQERERHLEREADRERERERASERASQREWILERERERERIQQRERDWSQERERILKRASDQERALRMLEREQQQQSAAARSSNGAVADGGSKTELDRLRRRAQAHTRWNQRTSWRSLRLLRNAATRGSRGQERDKPTIQPTVRHMLDSNPNFTIAHLDRSDHTRAAGTSIRSEINRSRLRAVAAAEREPSGGFPKFARDVVDDDAAGMAVASEREKRFYLALDDDIEKAPSIGARTADYLARANIRTVRDLIVCNVEDAAAKIDVRFITPQRLELWKTQSRLVCCIPWLRGTHAQLLTGAGFDSIEKIEGADRAVVCAAILQFATTRDGQSVLRSGEPPDIERVGQWVEAARLAEPQRAVAA